MSKIKYKSLKSVPEEVFSKATSLVLQSVSELRSQRNQIEADWENYDMAYRATFNKNEQAYKGDSKYASAQLHDNVEAIVGRTCESVIITDKTLDISTADPNQKYKASVYKQIAIKQSEQQEIENKKEVLDRMLSIFGTAIVKVPWKKEMQSTTARVVQEFIETDAEGQPIIDLETGKPKISMEVVEETKDVIKYIGPGYDIITDLADIYVDMFVQNIQDQPIVVHRTIATWEDIKQGIAAEIYFKDAAKGLKDSNFLNTKTGPSRSESILGSLGTSNMPRAGIEKEYELLEAWCKFDYLNNGEEIPCVITICNGSLLGLRPNPFWHGEYPFLVGKYREVAGEFYGIGAIQPVYKTWLDYNDAMNQINDARNFCLNPVIITQSGTTADNQTWDIFPGVIWKEKVQGSIRKLEQSLNEIVVGQSVLLEMEQRINKGMGVTSIMQGQGDIADLEDVAYKATQKISVQSDKKFKRIVKRFEHNFWQQWIEMGFKLNAQLNDQKMLFTGITDPQTGKPIPLEINIQDIVGEYTFTCRGVDYFFDLQDQLTKTITFSQITANKPWINGMELDRQIADMMSLKDIDKIIVQPAPSKQEVPKPANVSINLDPSKGTSIALYTAQVLKQNGYTVDLNQVMQETDLISKSQTTQAMLQSGLLPQGVEEDILAQKNNGPTVSDKVEIVHGGEVPTVKRTIESTK